MKCKVQVEAMGNIVTTPKGFLREYIALDETGGKSVIKIFSKNAEELQETKVHARIVEVNSFCFAPRA